MPQEQLIKAFTDNFKNLEVVQKEKMLKEQLDANEQMDSRGKGKGRERATFDMNQSATIMFYDETMREELLRRNIDPESLLNKEPEPSVQEQGPSTKKKTTTLIGRDGTLREIQHSLPTESTPLIPNNPESSNSKSAISALNKHGDQKDRSC